MSLLGKLLAILNVLAAIGFVFLVVMDWQARHQWVHAVFVHERAIEGLPFNDKETDPDGNNLAKDMTEKTRLAILGGGKPVKTQVQEVGEVKNELQSKITSSDPVKFIDGFDYGQNPLTAPHQKLAYVLLPL